MEEGAGGPGRASTVVTRGGKGSRGRERGQQTRGVWERLGGQVHTALGFRRQEPSRLCLASLCDPAQGRLPEHPHLDGNVGRAPPAPHCAVGALGKQNPPRPCWPLPRPQLSPGSEEDEAHEGCSRENLGRIQFSVGYNFQESTLTVKIMKAQELPAKDFSGTSDPFVKIYLLPDKKHKLETKVKRKNLNPHWNETFLFEGEAGATPRPPPPHVYA